MKVSKEDLENREVSLSIEVEDGDLEPYMDRAYRHLVQRINVPGFRKGKAPRTVVEHVVGGEVMTNEAMEFFIPEAVDKAIEQEEVEQGGAPTVEVMQQEPSVILKATVPLAPKVTLDAYREIRVPSVPIEVTEDEVNHVLEDLRYAHAPWGPVERPVELGDQVTIDAHGDVAGKEVTNQQGVVYYVAENNTTPLKGFSEALVGAELGQTTEFTIPIPDDYQDQELAGKDCKFSVTVHEIKAKLLADLDDEFAKEIGDGYDSLEALTEKLREDLRARKEADANQKYEESVMEELIGRTTVEISPMLVDHEAEHILDDEERTLKQQRVNVEQYLAVVGRSVDEHREDARQMATERITRAQALNKVAELEGIEATDEEIDEEIEQMLQGMDNRSARRSRRDLSTPETRESLGTIIARRKALQRLISIAKGEAPAAPEEPEPPEESSEESSPEEAENAVSSE